MCQGESLAMAFENVVRASYLNVTKSLVASAGPQFLLQTALYARIGRSSLNCVCQLKNASFIFFFYLGVSHLSWLNTEVFRVCYSNSAPFEDLLKSTFWNCLLVCSAAFRLLALSLSDASVEAGTKGSL